MHLKYGVDTGVLISYDNCYKALWIFMSAYKYDYTALQARHQ